MTASFTTRLKIIGAENDVPGKLTAYASVKGFGELALLLGPGPCIVAHLVEHQAQVWEGRSWASPAVLSTKLSPAEAVQRMRLAASAPLADSPETYRGRWDGQVRWTGQGDTVIPSVVLVRHVSSYAVLGLESGPQGWKWAVRRSGKWFTAEKLQSSSSPQPFAEALKDGLAAALELVRDACGMRDTRRRGAFDPAHASAHPPKPKKPVEDATQKLGEPKPKPKSEAAKRGPRKASFKVLRAAKAKGIEGEAVQALLQDNGGVRALQAGDVSIWTFPDESALALRGRALLPVKKSRATWKELDEQGKVVKEGWSLKAAAPKPPKPPKPPTPATAAPKPRSRKNAADSEKDAVMTEAIRSALRAELAHASPAATA